MTPVPIIWLPFASPDLESSCWELKETEMFSRRSNSGQKWGKVLIRLIFQMLLCQCVRWEQSKAKTPTPFAPLSLGCRELRRSSRTSAAHLLFIRQPLPPPRLGQLRPGSCARCLTRLMLRWSALMSPSTPRSLEPSLNGAEGDYVTACLWGRSIFLT